MFVQCTASNTPLRVRPEELAALVRGTLRSASGARRWIISDHDVLAGTDVQAKLGTSARTRAGPSGASWTPSRKERPRLLAIPATLPETDSVIPVVVDKTAFVRLDRAHTASANPIRRCTTASLARRQLPRILRPKERLDASQTAKNKGVS